MKTERAFLIGGDPPKTAALVRMSSDLTPRERDVRDYARMTEAERATLARVDATAHQRMLEAWNAAGRPRASQPAGAK